MYNFLHGLFHGLPRLLKNNSLLPSGDICGKEWYISIANVHNSPLPSALQIQCKCRFISPIKNGIQTVIYILILPGGY